MEHSPPDPNHPAVLANLDPELDGLALGIPADVLGKVKNATPTHGLVHFFSAARLLVGGGFQSAKARVYGNFLMRNISFYGNIGSSHSQR
jgi:hypothetical protein